MTAWIQGQAYLKYTLVGKARRTLREVEIYAAKWESKHKKYAGWGMLTKRPVDLFLFLSHTAHIDFLNLLVVALSPLHDGLVIVVARVASAVRGGGHTLGRGLVNGSSVGTRGEARELGGIALTRSQSEEGEDASSRLEDEADDAHAQGEEEEAVGDSANNAHPGDVKDHRESQNSKKLKSSSSNSNGGLVKWRS